MYRYIIIAVYFLITAVYSITTANKLFSAVKHSKEQINYGNLWGTVTAVMIIAVFPSILVSRFSAICFMTTSFCAGVNIMSAVLCIVASEGIRASAVKKDRYAKYSEQAKKEASARKFRHDIKNALYGAKALVDNGDYEKASEYLGKLSEKAREVLDKKSYSDNLIADAVLSDLARRCQDEKIDFYADVTVGSELDGIDDADMCVLFGNIADNAFEEMKRISGKRFISIFVSRREKWFIICAENSCGNDTCVADSDGNIPTSKTEAPQLHGIGLSSIREITESAGGTVKSECENGVFRLSLVFPRNK